jgi:broad specificity phosphatase PhoE
MGRLETVYTSPLERAQATATAIATTKPVVVDDLQELSMGRWEGLTTTEIMTKDPDLFARIYERGEDAKRGGDGESWAELTVRVRAAIEALPLEPGSITGVVSHGGAIRAYISSLTSTTDTHSQSLYTPPNTGVTHVALTSQGPVLLDYALAPHLDGAAE